MTSAAVMSPALNNEISMHSGLETSALFGASLLPGTLDAPLARNSFPLSRKSLAAGKGANVQTLLDSLTLPFAAPVAHQRGPLDGRLLRSWQYAATGKATAAAVLTDLKVTNIKHGGPLGIHAEASKYIADHKLDDTFYVVDLGNTLRMLKAWRAAMPRVTPFYAVKCNPEAGMLQLLNAMGTGFDCASKGELEMMLKMGVHPSRIIFAHPCKRPCDIRYAKEHGVEHTTFDTDSELIKIAQMHPGFKLVLRIRADDPGARVPLGLKYGAEVSEAPRLLKLARQLGLNVMGVSFHVGSACQNLATFTGAIESAREIFDTANEMGFSMELLDIGGGFTGHFDAHGNVMFGEIASTINAALAANFPAEQGVRVIAEPGRYFAETSASLLTPIYGQRERVDAETNKHSRDYWITDGLYGSFNCMIYDGQNPGYRVLRSPLLPPVPCEPGGAAGAGAGVEPLLSAAAGASEAAAAAAGSESGVGAAEPLHVSTVWGPTCDSADVVYKDVMLPELRNGDWLHFPNAGAYTVAGACDFNGIEFTTPNKFYVYSDSAVDGGREEVLEEDVQHAEAPVAASLR